MGAQGTDRAKISDEQLGELMTRKAELFGVEVDAMPGGNLSAEQQTKTRTALEFFAGEAAEAAK